MTEQRVPSGGDESATTLAEPRAPRQAAAPKKTRQRHGGAPSDPVADMLTRLRNAVVARHETVALPASRLLLEIARILKNEGFIAGYEQPAPRQMMLRLKYIGGKVSAVSGLRRISKPGLRVYARKTEMPRVLGGLGIAIVSTPNGLMTGREAERAGLGGEVLAYVW